MLRARLHVPHGGAAKIPARFGAFIQVMNSACPFFVVKSAIMIGATELSFLWSTPNAENTPLDFRAAVSLPEPANSSMTTGPSRKTFLFCFWGFCPKSEAWLISEENSLSKDSDTTNFGKLPTPMVGKIGDEFLHESTSRLSEFICCTLLGKTEAGLRLSPSSWLVGCSFGGCKDDSKLLATGLPSEWSALECFCWSFRSETGCSWRHEWSFRLWFAKHLAQQCFPRRHEEPSAASSQPSMLYLKQIFDPSGVLPTPPAWMIWYGARGPLLEPFDLPLPFECFWNTVVLTAAFGFGAAATGADFFCWGRGNRLKETAYDSSAFMRPTSKGKVPSESRRGLTPSSNSLAHTALSAATIWDTEVRAYPGCGSRCIWANNAARYLLHVVNVTRSAKTNPTPRRSSASLTWSAECAASSGTSLLSLTMRRSASISTCFVGLFWWVISCMRLTQRSGARYWISFVWCIWAQASRSEWPGSSGPSMSNPAWLFLTCSIFESRSVGGTFLVAAESGATTCSFRDAITSVCDSKSRRFKAEQSASVTPGLTSCLTQLLKASSAMFWPGCPKL